MENLVNEQRNKIINEKDVGVKAIPIEIINKNLSAICLLKVGANEDKEKGTGFFIKINMGKEYIFLITASHVIDDDYINDAQKFEIFFNFEKGSSSKNKETINEKATVKVKRKERKIICLKKQDITAIEIIDTDEFKNKIKCLFCDLNYIDGNNTQYINQDIFILQHPRGEVAHVAAGKIIELDKKDDYKFMHTASTDGGSSGSPIILYNNERVVGVHKGALQINNEEIVNLGTFIGVIIDEIKELIMKEEEEEEEKEEEEEDEKENDSLNNENEGEDDLNNKSNLFRYKLNGDERLAKKSDSIVVKLNDVISFSNKII